MKIQFNYSEQEAKAIFLTLLGLDILLGIIFVLIHIVGTDIPMGPIRPMFDLDQDLSVPGWYSAIKLLAVGVVLFIASTNNQYNRYLPSSFLRVLSFVFIFFSADEGSAIHEKITPSAKNLQLDWLLIEGHGAWILLYLILGFPIILLSIRYFRRGWRHFRRETVMGIGGAIVLLTGAVAFEIIGYLFFRSESMLEFYRIQVVFEEVFEMAGVSIILFATLLLANALSYRSTPVLGIENANRSEVEI